MRLSELIFGPSPSTIIRVQNEAFSMAMRVAMGVDPKPTPSRDLFGNRHKPDGGGYCSCWQCPKFDGVDWWTPNPRFQKKPLTRKEQKRV